MRKNSLKTPLDPAEDHFYPDIIICPNDNLKYDIHNYIDVSELDRFSYLAVEFYSRHSSHLLHSAANLTVEQVPQFLQDLGYNEYRDDFLHGFEDGEELLMPRTLYQCNSILNINQTMAAMQPLHNTVMQCIVRYNDGFDCMDYFTEFVSDSYGICHKLEVNKILEITMTEQSGFLWGIELLLYLPNDKWSYWTGELYIGARVTLTHPNHPIIPEDSQNVFLSHALSLSLTHTHTHTHKHESGIDVVGGQMVTIEYDQVNTLRGDDDEYSDSCIQTGTVLNSAQFSHQYSVSLCKLHCYDQTFEQLVNCSASRYFSTKLCGFKEKDELDSQLISEMADACIAARCKQPCFQSVYNHKQQVSNFPTLNDAQFFLAKLLLELEKNSSRYKVPAKHATNKYLDAVEAGKILLCNLGQDVTSKCEDKVYTQALVEAKQGFTKLHIFRGSSDVTVMSEISSYTEFTLISNVGAQMGLWAGLTFLSLYDYLIQYTKLIGIFPAVQIQLERFLLVLDKMGKVIVKYFRKDGVNRTGDDDDLFTETANQAVQKELQLEHNNGGIGCKSENMKTSGK
ncbi:uncharacterized protein LOC142348381 [Convolutriloba macropyga]|uniref:uncharacterized protein LOC142348381 n=1 Tax=Convolutriloba macropyga TaxID=536237 RepID=UPI003F51D85F